MSIGIGNGIMGGIVMLGIVGVIVLIECRPTRVGPVGECSMGGVEFIREYESVGAVLLWILFIISCRIRIIGSNAGRCGGE